MPIKKYNFLYQHKFSAVVWYKLFHIQNTARTLQLMGFLHGQSEININASWDVRTVSNLGAGFLKRPVHLHPVQKASSANFTDQILCRFSERASFSRRDESRRVRGKTKNDTVRSSPRKAATASTSSLPIDRRQAYVCGPQTLPWMSGV